MYNPQITVDRVRAIACEKGVSISNLNETCELSKNTITQSGKGTEGMKAKNLYMIAETLGCSVDYLLGRTDNPNTVSNNFTVHEGIQAVSKDSSHFTFNHVDEPQDENQEELLKRFKLLDYEDKIEIMQMIIQKTKMKGNK